MNKLIVFLASIILLFIQYLCFHKCLKYINEQNVKETIQNLNLLSNKLFFENKRWQNSKSYKQSLKISQFLNNEGYCIDSDVMKFFHPDIVLKDIHSSRETDDLTKEVIQSLTYGVGEGEKINVNNKSVVPSQLSIPFHYYDYYLTRTQTGISGMCLFQKNNHMTGRKSLAYKNELLNNYYNYVQKLKRNSSECLKNVTYIPKSYRLYLKDECLDFFQFTNSSEFKQKMKKEGPQFISKLGLEVHRGAGITMLFQEQLKKLQIKYKYGEQCGNVSQLLIAQQYINNPYLYQGHKIEFRIYFIVASTYPLIVYAYDSSLIRRCALPFNKDSLEKSSHVCNTAIVKQTFGDSAQDNVFINWKLDYLQELLLKDKKIKSKNWLEKQLYPKIHRTIQHLILSTEHHFQKDSKLAEFFGVDFMLTQDLNIYVLEVNSNPQLLKTTPQRIDQNTKLVQDILEIQVAYLRSKFIRLRQLINEIVQGKIKDIENSFKLAYQDKLEEEIKISKSNLFRKIIDRNLNGSRAYNDLIEEKCLI